MNFFQFHIGDYAAATSHLSLIEDAVYSRLLRRYYLDEQPLPADIKQTARLAGARTPEEVAAVEAVLAEFFTLGEEGWQNKRADEEIAAYRDKSEKAKASARASVSARTAKAQQTPSESQANVERTLNERPTDVELTINHKPLTINQEPSNTTSSEQSPDTTKASRKKFGTAEDREAAEWIFDRIKATYPTAKQPSMDAWANDVRLMREQDGRSHREICELFGWANRDGFWSANILSPAKLREKWTQLCAQRSRPAQAVAQPINKQQAQEDRNRAALANWRPPELRGDSYERG